MDYRYRITALLTSGALLLLPIIARAAGDPVSNQIGRHLKIIEGMKLSTPREYDPKTYDYNMAKNDLDHIIYTLEAEANVLSPETLQWVHDTAIRDQQGCQGVPEKQTSYFDAPVIGMWNQITSPCLEKDCRATCFQELYLKKISTAVHDPRCPELIAAKLTPECNQSSVIEEFNQIFAQKSEEPIDKAIANLKQLQATAFSTFTTLGELTKLYEYTGAALSRTKRYDKRSQTAALEEFRSSLLSKMKEKAIAEKKTSLYYSACADLHQFSNETSIWPDGSAFYPVYSEHQQLLPKGGGPPAAAPNCQSSIPIIRPLVPTSFTSDLELPPDKTYELLNSNAVPSDETGDLPKDVGAITNTLNENLTSRPNRGFTPHQSGYPFMNQGQTPQLPPSIGKPVILLPGRI
ncbi:MAG: hypothetical protein HQK50_14680 [Oligoflexia bacterium]|nr:hypothetical protein [Oligoflexia bacterium]